MDHGAANQARQYISAFLGRSDVKYAIENAVQIYSKLIERSGLARKIAIALDSQYSSPTDFSHKGLTDDVFQTWFLLSCVMKNPSADEESRVRAVYDGFLLSRLVSFDHDEDWKVKLRAYTENTSNPFTYELPFGTVQLRPDRVNLFIDITLNEAEYTKTRETMYIIMATTLVETEQSMMTFAETIKNTIMVGISQPQQGGRHRVGTSRALAASYQKTGRKHTDSKGVTRVVYMKKGSNCMYIKKKARGGSFKFVKI